MATLRLLPSTLDRTPDSDPSGGLPLIASPHCLPSLLKWQPLFSPSQTRGDPLLDAMAPMIVTIEAQMTSLTKRGQVLIPHIMQVVFTSGPSIGLCDAQMCDGQHDLGASDRMRLVILGATPLTAISGPIVADAAADLMPVRRILFVVDRHGCPPLVDFFFRGFGGGPGRLPTAEAIYARE